ncbi:MAG: hypothetical protein ACRDDW_03260, partial [Candidatus Rhabdochlamydia sp.]
DPTQFDFTTPNTIKIAAGAALPTTIGTAGQVLISNGTSPVWANITSTLATSGSSTSGITVTSGPSSVVSLSLLPPTGVNNQILVGTSGTGYALKDFNPVQFTVTGAAGTPANTVSVKGLIFWQVISASQALASNNGYIITGGAVSLSLPATSVVGDTVIVVLDTGTSWSITQTGSQQVRLGSSITTSGSGGSLASNAAGDTITLVCTSANTRWVAYATMGNITVV